MIHHDRIFKIAVDPGYARVDPAFFEAVSLKPGRPVISM
jgi:hypothetical protein